MNIQQARTESFEYHRRHPDVSLESHVRQRRLALGAQTASVLKVYLDLRFWILFRKAKITGDRTSEIALLLDHLLDLVRNGLAVCPISESTFIELLKQDCPNTRRSTADLIDHLSRGVSFVPYPDRVRQELCHSYYYFSGVEDLVPIEHCVWTKLPYVLGEHHPTNTPFPEGEELIIQKAFFDHLWGVSLVDMIDSADLNSLPENNWDATAERLNKANSEHRRELRSFPHAYRIEFEGTLSLFTSDIKLITQNLRSMGIQNIGVMLPKKSQTAKFKIFAKSIPTLHIGSCCHAAVRWNSGQKLDGNDLFDFHHAQGALGYCDVFLTEGPLRDQLHQKHHRLSEDYACEIFSSAQDALEWFGARDG
ncbi:MAG: hypothetical protein EVA65_05500 [Oceanococcus sp.]|nr:MAG: hypothetical protein EVA65_05500 [Oceanococcus sp.]